MKIQNTIIRNLFICQLAVSFIAPKICISDNNYVNNEYCGIYNSNKSGKKWIDSIKNSYGPVIFKAYKHDNIGCKSCHHPTKNNEFACGKCHAGDRLKDAYHQVCCGCHKEENKGPVDCIECHEKSERYKYSQGNIVIGKYKKVKSEVNFRHAEHELWVKQCVSCHHKEVPGREKLCTECHYNINEGKKVSAEQAFHIKCIECHKINKKGPTKCNDCHFKTK